MVEYFVYLICIVCALQNFLLVNANYAPIIRNANVECVGLPKFSEIIPIEEEFIINQTNFEVKYNLFPESCIFVFVITQVEIKVEDGEGVKDCLQENNVNISEYLITSKFEDLRSSTKLDTNSNYLVKITNSRVVVTIDPILAEDLYISRFVATPDNYCVNYGLVGYSLIRAVVLSYTISLPMLITQGDRGADDTYTGWCNDELCFGGKGQLMDGVIGDSSDNSQSFIIVGWRCFADGDANIETNCTFKLSIILTGPANISDIIFYGYQTQSLIRPPEIQLVYPDINANAVTSDVTTSTYTVRLPINQVVDRIDIDMNVQEQRKLVLSEVEVLSQNVNMGPLNIGYTHSIVNTTTSITTGPTTTTTTTTIPLETSTIITTTTSTMNSTLSTLNNEYCNNTVTFVVFSFIVVIQFILLLLLFVCCIYTTVKCKAMKENMNLIRNTNKPRNESEYSRGLNHGTLYASIDLGSQEHSATNNINNVTRSNKQQNRLPSIPVITTQSRRKPVLVANIASIGEPLILQSPGMEQKTFAISATNDVAYQNSASVAMVDRHNATTYDITENTLYGRYETEEPGTTVYGQLDVDQTRVEFSGYDKINHK